jgi:hypothetical protein
MDAIVDFAGVEEYIDVPLKRFSSGMYVRLAFSVAVNMEPDVLLADEVLAVGDLAFQERCLQRVETAAGSEGLTVLFVSHDMSAIRRLCSRVVWMNGGRIVMDGEPDDVVSAYEQAAWSLMAHTDESGEHASSFGEILDTRLVDALGNEVATVRVDEPVTIRVTVRLNQPNVGYRCLLAFNADGIDAFRAVQPELQHPSRPGTHVVEVTVPAHLLADTVYTVKSSFWLALDGIERRDISLVHRHALTFRVYDTNEADSARGTYSGPLHGVVRPKLAGDVSAPVGAHE